MAQPLLPIAQQEMTKIQTADMLRGLAEFIELYPAERFVLSVQLEVAASESSTRSRASSKRSTKKS